MWTTKAHILIIKHVIMLLPGMALEQEPNEKARKGSKRENYNCNREGIEDFQRTITFSWTSTLLFTLVGLQNPARKVSLQPVIRLGWAARLLTAFKTHLKCWEAPESCLVALMRKRLLRSRLGSWVSGHGWLTTMMMAFFRCLFACSAFGTWHIQPWLCW